MLTRIKTDKEINAMRESGRLLAIVHAVLREALQPGMTTKDLAEIAKRELRGTGGQPTFLGYHSFPDVLCVSVNNEVVHGIPDPRRVIKNGDVVSLDFGVTYEGMITDAAFTAVAGKTSNSNVANLIENTRKSLYAGLKVINDGVKTGDIGNAIQNALEKHGYGIVRDLVGHGVGHELHEDPNIPNIGKKGIGPELKAGMTIAVEPMATLGSHKVYTGNDGWTVLTQDGSIAAHFEHTVLITENGAEILTSL